ncbi:MAG: hypothetical protein ACK559_22795, partial [bacterium]
MNAITQSMPTAAGTTSLYTGAGTSLYAGGAGASLYAGPPSGTGLYGAPATLVQYGAPATATYPQYGSFLQPAPTLVQPLGGYITLQPQQPAIYYNSSLY